MKASYFWRPEGKTFISWGPTIQQSNIWDHAGTRLENYFWPGVRFDFTRSTWFNVHPFGYDYSRLRPQDYNGLTRVSAYRNSFWGIEGGTSWFKEVDINWFFDSGGGINFNPSVGRIPVSAHEDQVNVTVSLHAGARLRVDNSYLLEHLRERDAHLTDVTNHIIRSKWNYQFTKELSARVILQYNSVLSNPLLSSLSRTKAFNADFLISYLPHPGTAIYIGYNSDLQNFDQRLIPTATGLLTTRNDFLNDSRQFFVKVSYLFRP